MCIRDRAQDASLTTMLNQVSAGDFDTVSTLWNMAYDAGWGLGAITLGLIATQSGYSTALLLMALAMIALAGILRAPAPDRSSRRPGLPNAVVGATVC